MEVGSVFNFHAPLCERLDMIFTRFRSGRFARTDLFLLLAGITLLGTAVWYYYPLLLERWHPFSGTSPTPTSHILYLDQNEQGKYQLFIAGLDGSGKRALTPQTADVPNFAVSPDKSQIAYVIEDESSNTAVWLMDANGRHPHQLLACPQAICSEIVWAPDGRRLIYERREKEVPQEPVGFPRLWWLDIASGETIPVLQNNYGRAAGARFSADGQWLSYVALEEEAIQLYHLEDGRHFLIDTPTGTPVAWHPQKNIFLTTELKVTVLHGSDDNDHQEHSHDFYESIHLALVEADTAETTILSPSGVADDGTAVWSADGEWIAFGRKRPRVLMGRQLWIMRADGSEAQALTDAPEIHHGVPAWSPDGRYLLFQRYPVYEPGARPGIWLLEVATGTMIEVSTTGIRPAWLS